MKKALSGSLAAIVFLSGIATFTACDGLEEGPSLADQIVYPELEDYVLTDEVLEFDGVRYQNSSLGYIGVGLVDETIASVTMCGYLVYTTTNVIPVYAYAEDFLCNNTYVTEVELEMNSYLRLYENTVHDLPNLTKFTLTSGSSVYYDDGKGTPQIEKNAISVACDYTVDGSFPDAVKCFPLDVDRFVFEEGMGVELQYKVRFEEPKRGVDEANIVADLPCIVTFGNHTMTFSHYLFAVNGQGSAGNGNYYYISVNTWDVLIEKGGKIPRSWIPTDRPISISVQADFSITYRENRLTVFEQFKEYTIEKKGLQLNFGKNYYELNADESLSVQAYLTMFLPLYAQ